MNWPSRLCKPKKQTARAVLVVWVVFNHFSDRNDLAYLRNGDAPQDGLVNCVLRELKGTFCNLLRMPVIGVMVPIVTE